MWSILLPVIIVTAIGLVAGIGLSIASVIFKVPVNKTFEAARECLPGANCGSCGFSGCDGYATALADGSCTDASLCAAGGSDTATALSAILGLESSQLQRKVAVVRCQGNANTKMNYHGTKSCRTAKQLFGGPNACADGCIGLGDCRKFCPFDAITMVNGLPRVDTTVCRGCGVCVRNCPKELIVLVPAGKTWTVRCRNTQKGAKAVKVCTNSCIGCGMCVKACQNGAVVLENNRAVIDPALCKGCGACAAACKRNAITPVIE